LQKTQGIVNSIPTSVWPDLEYYFQFLSRGLYLSRDQAFHVGDGYLTRLSRMLKLLLKLTKNRNGIAYPVTQKPDRLPGGI